MKKTDYKESIFRYLTPFVVGFIISIHSRFDEIMVALVTPLYYLALGISIAAAFGIMFVIRTVSSLLNRHYPIKGNFWKRVQLRTMRILLQLLCGIGIPAVLELITFELYFRAMGLDIFSSYFVYDDFPLVLAFMVIVNIFYFDYNGRKNKVLADEEGDYIYIKRYGKITRLCISRDVLYIRRSAKGIHIFTTDGKQYNKDLSLAEVISKHGTTDLIQINRSVLINKGFVEAYTKIPRRDILQLEVSRQYKHLSIMKDDNLFKVTKEHIEAFKQHFREK